MYGILLIHGFDGSRSEIAPLADYLKERGFAVSTPCLAGHEKTKKLLAAATYSDWISDVKKSYDELALMCDKTAVIGFSMGGLLAVQLYSTQKYDRLVTVNTPIYYWDFVQMGKNLRADFRTYIKKYLSVSAAKPLRALYNFQRLLSKTKPLFRETDCPALVIQVQDDDTVNARSGDYIVRSLKGEKQYFKPLYGGHVLLQSNAFGEVADRIYSFLQGEQI